MSREEEAKNIRLYDSRTIERTIRKGLLTRKDYDKYLKGLPDVTDKAAPADISATEDDDLESLEDEDEDEDEIVGEGETPEGGAPAA